jgi:hypothetical protein
MKIEWKRVRKIEYVLCWNDQNVDFFLKGRFEIAPCKIAMLATVLGNH